MLLLWEFIVDFLTHLLQAQIVLLIILLAAIADFIIGTFIGPKTDMEMAKGFIGYNSELSRNIYHCYKYQILSFKCLFSN